MIVDRILAYLGTDRLKVSDELLAPALVAIGRSVKRNLGNEGEGDRDYISGSSPWYCPTRMYHGIAGTKRERGSARSRLTFLYGDVIEQTTLLVGKQAGVPFLSPDADGRQYDLAVMLGGTSVPVHPDASIAVPVRMPDGTEGTEEIPVEVKSMAEKTFLKFSEACRNPTAEWWDTERWAYLAQVRLQMRALGERQGLRSVTRGIIVGVCKNTHRLAELHVPYDATTFGVFDRAVPATLAAKARGIPPPRPAWATCEERPGQNELPGGRRGPCLQVSHWRCRFCPFVRACWQGFDLVPLPSGPEWRRSTDTATN